MSAFRWLSADGWSSAQLTGLVVQDGVLTLAPGPAPGSGSGSDGFTRRGIAVLRAGFPAPAQVDGPATTRWRRVQLRIAAPPPTGCWLRIWLLVADSAAVPSAPEPATADGDRASVPSSAGRWRAAPAGAIDARVLCWEDGPLWVAVELGGTGTGTPQVAGLRVETGDDEPVTGLPIIYRRTTALGSPAGTSPPGAAGTGSGSSTGGADDGDGVLGRYLGLLGAQLRQTASILGELPGMLSPAVAPDRADSPWLTRLATWVACDPALLPAGEAARRETVSTAAARHGWRGTRRGLIDQVRRETGLTVEIAEPLEQAVVWRLDSTASTSALGLTTGLVSADPGPPALDRTAWLGASMLIAPEDAGLPVHARLAHRICVHVPDGTPTQVAAVDRVVQRERPAHVLARTCAMTHVTRIPTEVGTDAIPRHAAAGVGLPNDTVYDPRIDGPGARIGTARLPSLPAHRTTGDPQ